MKNILFCCKSISSVSLVFVSDTLPVVVNVTGGPSETDIPIPLPEESFSYTFTLQSSGIFQGAIKTQQSALHYTTVVSAIINFRSGT